MSLISGIRGFSVSMYGQSGIVMDWFGLNDPFTQQVPLKISNTYSGTLWFQGALINPRSGYYNYSGIQMGLVNSGASTTLVMTWDAGVSGWITGSSLITDTLTLNLTTYTSSNYTGSYSSGNFTVLNTLFTRWSGVIKVFGDIYSNDQPTPSVVQGAAGGTLSGIYSYAVSYNMSGWESDVGAPTSININNSGFGTANVSWTSVAGTLQYFLFRFSGTPDFTIYSGNTPPNAGFLRPMDLIAVQGTTSFTDTGVAAIQSNLFRHRTWQEFLGSGTTDNTVAASDTATFLTSPASRSFVGAGQSRNWSHGYMVGKNMSGTSLLGPFFGVVHVRPRANGAMGFFLNSSTDGLSSGTAIADSVALNNQLSGVWYRHVFLLGASGTISASGTIHLQILDNNMTINVDDAFVVAQS